ncbi:MAG: AAA family ATPase, partial [Candidatus Saccharimonas sp.]|nr:AAA family ATPase [Planctomycetaceae bacterium]
LCVGVFGPPGAGKSFGVEEVITSIGGERVSKLTFNVSQFATEKDLVAACHRIRDKVLEGKTPFVFFDEFDSAGLDGTELGWLRSFLALMQDGKFRDGEEMHPLGKCILVFAGGTSATFRGFEDVALSTPPARKGRDFVSRLHGYINILGPNQQGEDPSFVLRRALVLRSMLERNTDAAGLFNSKQELQIDDGVLRALLLVSEYKHGTRSLESLLDMSQLEGKTRFDQYALPPRDQLLIHVPADEFMSLMQPLSSDSPEIEQFKLWLKAIGCEVRPIPPGRNSEWGGTGDRPQTPLIGDDDVLALAESAHQWWKAGEKSDRVARAAEEVPGKTTPYLCTFAELPIAIRTPDVNRVEQIPAILHDAGLEIFRPDEPEDWTDASFIRPAMTIKKPATTIEKPAMTIEKLAEIQHGSYQKDVDAEIETRREAGFLKRFNSNEKPFADLPPAKQESNRDAIRTIPRKLARIGLTLVPRDPAATEPEKVTIEKMAAKIAAKREALAVIEHTR